MADRTKTPTKLTTHEKYVAQVRAERLTATPYRIGLAVGAAGDNLPSPYPPGSRGDFPSIRIRSKLADYGGDAAKQRQDQESTAQMIHHLGTSMAGNGGCDLHPAHVSGVQEVDRG